MQIHSTIHTRDNEIARILPSNEYSWAKICPNEITKLTSTTKTHIVPSDDMTFMIPSGIDFPDNKENAQSPIPKSATIMEIILSLEKGIH